MPSSVLLLIMLPTIRALESFVTTTPSTLFCMMFGLATVSPSPLKPIRAVEPALMRTPAPELF